jgi:hypothetical protein
MRKTDSAASNASAAAARSSPRDFSLSGANPLYLYHLRTGSPRRTLDPLFTNDSDRRIINLPHGSVKQDDGTLFQKP